jgi:hypothetical protein
MEANCFLGSQGYCCHSYQDPEEKKKKKKVPVSKKAASTLKHQQYHKYVGYTIGQCLIGKDTLGVSIPVLKPFTDKLHVKAMVALSGLLKHHIFEDLRDRVYFDMVNPTHRCGFAQQLHEDNVLEALWLALSNGLHPCGCHEDKRNDKHPHFSLVITFSIFVEVDSVVYRLAIIGYSQKGICKHYEQQQKPNDLLIHDIQTVLNGLPVSQTD